MTGRPRNPQTLIAGVPHKHCGRCKRLIPLSGFGLRRHRWDGRNTECVECTRSESFLRSAAKTAERSRKRAETAARANELADEIRRGEFDDSRLEELRRATLNGECVICGKSGWVGIVHHIVGAHGLLGREFRDLLMFKYSESICSKELSEAISERNDGMFRGERNMPKKIRRTSKKAMEILRSTPRPWMTKDWHAAGGRVSGRLPREITAKHGTRAMYVRHRCRCTECKAANTAYTRQLDKRRRDEVRAAHNTGQNDG